MLRLGHNDQASIDRISEEAGVCRVIDQSLVSALVNLLDHFADRIQFIIHGKKKRFRDLFNRFHRGIEFGCHLTYFGYLGWRSHDHYLFAVCPNEDRSRNPWQSSDLGFIGAG